MSTSLWRRTRRRRIFQPAHGAPDTRTRPTGRVAPCRFTVAVRRAVVVVAAAAVSNGCAVLPTSTPVDPHVDFAAHPGYRGLVVDRMEGGQTAVLVRARSAPLSAGPTHLLQTDGKTIAALWVGDHTHVTVRQTPDRAAPFVGEVRASWKQGAMRLAFQSADGASFRTSRFDRIDSETFPNILDREMYSVLHLPGVYSAELRDAQNIPVGWLRVRILPYQGLPREYEASVPEPLNGPLATAAVALVDSEIDSIIDRNAFSGDRIPRGLAP